MDNKKLGLILVGFSVVLFVLFGIIRVSVYNAYEPQITYYGESCPSDPNICPHSQRERALIPINAGFAIAFGILSLGIYLIFFEKGQREIIKTLKETKEERSGEEKFNILLSGLDESEKKVIKAVKEQDGITQATLRIRTDMSKTKLSLVLTGLEKKGLVKKVIKGKTNQIFLKKAI